MNMKKLLKKQTKLNAKINAKSQYNTLCKKHDIELTTASEKVVKVGSALFNSIKATAGGVGTIIGATTRVVAIIGNGTAAVLQGATVSITVKPNEHEE